MDLEELLRRLAPTVLSATIRRHGQFDLAEDAVQEALLAAVTQWPVDGVPGSPEGWLVTVADRRMTDLVRSESARRRREERDALTTPEIVDGPAVGPPTNEADDSLALLVLCCHPALTAASQIALTLRAVGGLTTAEIAHAYLVPEATMAQRISRAKQRIRAAGATFHRPAPDERAERLRSVLHVLYLVFTEGHTATVGTELQRIDLAAEAIRLTRMLLTTAAVPEDGEIRGALALMLLSHARRAARTDGDGRLVPLTDQDRSRWDRSLLAEGKEHLTAGLAASSLADGTVGPYQLQAAIAAVHAEAADAAATDWRQITSLYALLDRIAPSPVVTLNRAVAVAMLDGPDAGLRLLDPLLADDRMRRHHRLAAVRAQLLEQAGDQAGARQAYGRAIELTGSAPERDHLQRRLEALDGLP